MLKSVRLKNFKLFKEADVPLERLTVFVGPNGSGKTTVLEAIYCLSQITHKESVGLPYVQISRLRPSQVRRRKSADPTEFGCEVTIGVESVPFEFVLVEYKKTGGTRWAWEEKGGGTRIWVEDRSEDIQTADPPSQREQYWRGGTFVRVPGKAILLRLDARQIAEPSEIGKSSEISESGEGIASILAEMALSLPDQFQKFQSAIASIIPNFERVRMSRTKILRTENLVYKEGEKIVSQPVGREFEAYKLILDMKSGPDLPGNCASEGTLLVIGILAILMGPSQPKLLLLDDIDHGLHPRAMAEFVKILRDLLDKDPELQIIATSHSPYLLDHLDYKEVRITSLDEEGLAHAALLSEHPDFERWKDVMSPGEFWSTVGESWAAGNGKPAHG